MFKGIIWGVWAKQTTGKGVFRVAPVSTDSTIEQTVPDGCSKVSLPHFRQTKPLDYDKSENGTEVIRQESL